MSYCNSQFTDDDIEIHMVKTRLDSGSQSHNPNWDTLEPEFRHLTAMLFCFHKKDLFFMKPQKVIIILAVSLWVGLLFNGWVGIEFQQGPELFKVWMF